MSYRNPAPMNAGKKPLMSLDNPKLAYVGFDAPTNKSEVHGVVKHLAAKHKDKTISVVTGVHGDKYGGTVTEDKFFVEDVPLGHYPNVIVKQLGCPGAVVSGHAASNEIQVNAWCDSDKHSSLASTGPPSEASEVAKVGVLIMGSSSEQGSCGGGSCKFLVAAGASKDVFRGLRCDHCKLLFHGEVAKSMSCRWSLDRTCRRAADGQLRPFYEHFADSDLMNLKEPEGFDRTSQLIIKAETS